MGWVKRTALQQEETAREPLRLGALRHAGVDVFCWCNRCGHNAVVETARLAAELGPMFPVPEIGVRMRCTGCGSKDIATRPAWPPHGPVTRHH